MASRCEEDVKLKAKILRRALEQIPTEVDLWKQLVGLEEPEEAK